MHKPQMNHAADLKSPSASQESGLPAGPSLSKTKVVLVRKGGS